MVRHEHRICYGGREATPESLRKVISDRAPYRSPGIAELENLRREESLKRFSRGAELAFHPLRTQASMAVPFLPAFDPSSSFGYYVESFPRFRAQLPDSNPLVYSDGTMPLLWNSFQNDTSSSSNSQLSFVISDFKQPPREPQFLFPFQKHELHQQISQVMNHSSLHPVPGAGLQMELELPSNQSRYGIVNASSWADQQIKMHQDAAQIQRLNVLEPSPISGSNCGTMVIDGSQGKNTDWSMDCSLSLHNVGVNLNSNSSTVKRIGASEEDAAKPIDGSTLSLVCLPPVCSSAWSPKTMSIRPISEMNVYNRQKRSEESDGSKASAISSEALVFYNFMELPFNDYIADQNVTAHQNKRSWESSDTVDVDLKL